jgi:hypothetical protein
MATLTATPATPPPNRPVQISFTTAESGANFVRLWVSSAPKDSELRKKLEQSTQSRVEVHAGDSNKVFTTNFDKGGSYTFIVQEYQRGASDYGGGYEGDPDAAPSETKLGSESTQTVYVAQRVELPIGANADTATVVLWLANDSVISTSIKVHGEATPALQAQSPTPRAASAMEDATVLTKLAALAGQTATTIVGSLASVIADYVATTGWNAHLANATAHDNTDTDNTIPVGLSVAPSAESATAFVETALQCMILHFTNDGSRSVASGGTASGRDSMDYHNVSGKKNDQANMPLVRAGGDVASNYIAVADLCRCYTAHIASAPPHNSADATNTLATRPPLMQLHEAFLSALASTSPATPAGQSSGVMTMIQLAGATEAPL